MGNVPMVGKVGNLKVSVGFPIALPRYHMRASGGCCLPTQLRIDKATTAFTPAWSSRFPLLARWDTAVAVSS